MQMFCRKYLSKYNIDEIQGKLLFTISQWNTVFSPKIKHTVSY